MVRLAGGGFSLSPPMKSYDGCDAAMRLTLAGCEGIGRLDWELRRGVRFDNDVRMDDIRARFVVEPGGELIVASMSRPRERSLNCGTDSASRGEGDKAFVYSTPEARRVTCSVMGASLFPLWAVAASVGSARLSSEGMSLSITELSPR